jgi:hypothetical protein
VVWVIVDVLLAVLAVIVLALIGLGLWRKVKDLGREVARAGEVIGRATEELAQLQATMPPPAPEGPTTSTVNPARNRGRTAGRRVG